MGQLKLAEYKTTGGDSISLTNIDGEKFTVIAVEDSDYTDGGDVTPGVKITTKEEFEIDGTKRNKFHTTRTVIVETLQNPKLREALSNGDTLGPIVCKKVSGKKYFSIEDAE